MNWGTKKPRGPGWYWWRIRDGDEEIVEVILYEGVLYVVAHGAVADLRGEWSQRVEPPGEPDE